MGKYSIGQDGNLYTNEESKKAIFIVEGLEIEDSNISYYVNDGHCHGIFSNIQTDDQTVTPYTLLKNGYFVYAIKLYMVLYNRNVKERIPLINVIRMMRVIRDKYC